MSIFNMLMNVLLCGFAILILYSLYCFIKARTELFTLEAMNQSFFSMGLLAIFLIFIVGITILLLRN